MVSPAHLAKINEQPGNGVFTSARHADGGADRVAFDQASDDLGPSLSTQLIHMD